MGKNRKKPDKLSPAERLQRARRELEKGRAKEALKEARLLFRQEPGEASRQFLEEAHVGRVEQLYAMRQFDDARTVLHELQQLQSSRPEIRQHVSRLQLVLGEGGQGALDLLERDPALLNKLTDEAVLDARCQAPEHPLVKPHLESVRQALQAVEQGDDEAAGIQLQAISRKSPLSDWKLLIRGLSAYYQNDDDRAAENWRRLDSQRPAWRIAQVLLFSGGQPPLETGPQGGPGFDVGRAARKVTESLEADPVFVLLQRMAIAWREEAWLGFFRDLSSLRSRFASTHSRQIEALVDLVRKRAIRNSDPKLLVKLMAAAPAPSWDPRWNLTQALVREENPDFVLALEGLRFMDAYLVDAATLPGFSEADRSLAAGLAHWHQASLLQAYLLFVSPPPDGSERGLVNPETNQTFAFEFERKLVRHFQQAVASSPLLKQAWYDWSEYHSLREETDLLIGVLLKMVEKHPDEVDAHSQLADLYQRRKQPERAAPHVQALLRLSPGSAASRALNWNQRCQMTSVLVAGGLWEEARQEMVDAVKNLPDGLEPYVALAIQAAIEIKAGEPAAAQAFIDAAVASMEEPLVVWLKLSHLAVQYGFPREIKKKYVDLFKQAVVKKPVLSSIVLAARFFYRLYLRGDTYSGQKTQEAAFLKYVKRSDPKTWARDDLACVLMYLSASKGNAKVRRQLGGEGRRRFPESAIFWYEQGILELEKGDDPRALANAGFYLSRAASMAESRSDLEDEMVLAKCPFLLQFIELRMDRLQDAYLFDDDYDD
ncbi:tetratricopeptide repeat protein [Lignipirellula cremea]|uniref:Uncharacterized protein n=1 Tax=Lignipirellula cremea TaxID=2528010 RepID=A0A518E3U3_9BACT|nr:hypothetical protein [Lignipirellula cremea]QDU98742.1 hypothetical protein Pla8534_66150 [Lignipirellula cremea]